MDESIDPIVEGLLKELHKEDDDLAKAYAELNKARIGFEVASRKYAAVRDVVAKRMGKNPYSDEGRRRISATKGRFRFIWMDTGDAIVDALKESEQPMTLDALVETLVMGGLRVAYPTRAVNAALMRTTGVEKTEDGTYHYEEQEEEEVPFE